MVPCSCSISSAELRPITGIPDCYLAVYGQHVTKSRKARVVSLSPKRQITAQVTALLLKWDKIASTAEPIASARRKLMDSSTYATRTYCSSRPTSTSEACGTYLIIYMYIHTYIHTYTHTDMCIYLYTKYIHMYLYIYILYTYMFYTYMFYTYLHTYSCSLDLGSAAGQGTKTAGLAWTRIETAQKKIHAS